jgi:hypothetical protein
MLSRCGQDRNGEGNFGKRAGAIGKRGPFVTAVEEDLNLGTRREPTAGDSRSACRRAAFSGERDGSLADAKGGQAGDSHDSQNDQSGGGVKDRGKVRHESSFVMGKGRSNASLSWNLLLDSKNGAECTPFTQLVQCATAFVAFVGVPLNDLRFAPG